MAGRKTGTKNLPEAVVKILKNWGQEHLMEPYAKKDNRDCLLKEINEAEPELDYTPAQLNQWMINFRRRDWIKMTKAQGLKPVRTIIGKSLGSFRAMTPAEWEAADKNHYEEVQEKPATASRKRKASTSPTDPDSDSVLDLSQLYEQIWVAPATRLPLMFSGQASRAAADGTWEEIVEGARCLIFFAKCWALKHRKKRRRS